MKTSFKHEHGGICDSSRNYPTLVAGETCEQLIEGEWLSCGKKGRIAGVKRTPAKRLLPGLGGDMPLIALAMMLVGEEGHAAARRLTATKQLLPGRVPPYLI